MDFFSHQASAQQQTRILYLYFIAASLITIAILNGLLYLLLYSIGFYPESFWEWLHEPLAYKIALLTLAVIIFNSLWRIYQLRQGGEYLAELIGAKRLTTLPSTTHTQCLQNVVEEMAIASGVAVPHIYILPQPSMNAFVAGYHTDDSVLVVTDTLLKNLNRDELQGVIAHEFSHILHGDMQLNLRLMGLLAGLLIIGQLGHFLLRGTTRRHNWIEFRRNNSDDVVTARTYQAIIMFIPAMVLISLGYIGLLMGRLVKAAISRQREFLADATAVQFTRYPQGLADALKKIKTHKAGSRLFIYYAEEISHLCFAATYNTWWTGLFATHPPLDQRIVRLDPEHIILAPSKTKQRLVKEGKYTPANTVAPAPVLLSTPTKKITAKAYDAERFSQHIVASIGQPTHQHLHSAQRLFKKLPEVIRMRLHQPEEAAAVLYALLITGTADEQKKRVLLLEKIQGKACADRAFDNRELLSPFGETIRLPLIDVTTPNLRYLSKEAQQQLLQTVDQLIKADGKVDLFEYVLRLIVRRRLLSTVSKNKQKTLQSFKDVQSSLVILFSLLARLGGGVAAYHTAMSKLFDTVPACKTQTTIQHLHQALTQLTALCPLLKKPLLDACCTCILYDEQVRVKEFELLRAIAETLECPMPPLLLTEGI